MGRFIFVFILILLASRTFAQQPNPVIAFTSDTQEPMQVEKILLKPNHNQQATQMIFKDVVAVHPAALFILGDVVSLSCNNKRWAHIDTYMQWCAQAHIPVYATLGNHEVMMNAKKGIKNFESRFPMYDPKGYVEIIDSVAVVLLNSNFSKMTIGEIQAQDNWYGSTIKRLDGDNAIKFIIVGCHHSPYTNSKVVKPSAAVQKHFVPAYIQSKKCVLFLTGHSHNFERFKEQGKYFIVIGGGGGLHQPLYTKEVSHDTSADYKPMFHYLEVRRMGDSLQITSRKLKPDFSGFDDGLTFNVR